MDTDYSKPNNAIDPNLLENLLPSNPPSTVCEETTTTPTVCEEVTTIPTITNCQTPEAFMCTKEGTFGDPGNCDDFFICHRKSRSDPTLKSIKMSCPDGTAFDEDVKQCTERARAQCLKKAEITNK